VKGKGGAGAESFDGDFRDEEEQHGEPPEARGGLGEQAVDGEGDKHA